MFALLSLLVALVTAPSVTLAVAQKAGPKNVHLHYVVVGPYDGRACLDVDDDDEQHVALFCASTVVTVGAGERAIVDDEVHGPAGHWVVTPVLVDTPGDDPVIQGTPQVLNIAQTLSASR